MFAGEEGHATIVVGMRRVGFVVVCLAYETC
jgi:hypothetical protein